MFSRLRAEPTQFCARPKDGATPYRRNVIVQVKPKQVVPANVIAAPWPFSTRPDVITCICYSNSRLFGVIRSQSQNEICHTAGAILAQSSEIHIIGNATFVHNSARRDGGEKHTVYRYILPRLHVIPTHSSCFIILYGSAVYTLRCIW